MKRLCLGKKRKLESESYPRIVFIKELNEPLGGDKNTDKEKTSNCSWQNGEIRIHLACVCVGSYNLAAALVVSNTGSLHRSFVALLPVAIFYCFAASEAVMVPSYSCSAPGGVQYLPYGVSTMTTYINMWLVAKVDKTGRTLLFPSKGWAVNKVQYEAGKLLIWLIS